MRDPHESVKGIVDMDVDVVVDADVVAVVCLDVSYGLIRPVSIETMRSRSARGFSRFA